MTAGWVTETKRNGRVRRGAGAQDRPLPVPALVATIDQVPITWLLVMAARSAEKIWRSGTHEISYTSYCVLTTIHRHPQCSQTDITRATGIDRSTTCQVIANLLRQRLVIRSRVRQDVRRYALTLAPGVAEILEELREYSESIDGVIAKEMGAGVIKALQHFVVKTGGSMVGVKLSLSHKHEK